MDDVIRTLCWYQPFGSLMLHGKIETRMWNRNCKVRGKVLIYTSNEPMKIIDLFDMVGGKILDRITDTLKNEPTKDLNGYAIAIGDLTDYRYMKPEDELMAFVPYLPERKCLIFENIKRIKPFVLSREFRGQGFRTLDENEKTKINII